MSHSSNKTTAGLTTGEIRRDSEEAAGRYIKAASKTVDAANRRVEFVASTIEVDRHGEVVLPSAFKARIEQWRKGHRPFLAGHQPWVEAGHPTQIGTIETTTIETTLVTIGVVYARTDVAEQHWILAADPAQSVAVSIGFCPIKWVRGAASELARKYPELRKPFRDAGVADDDQVRVYTEIELLEVSQVSVPANRGAIQLAKDLAGGDGASADAIVDQIAEAVAAKLLGRFDDLATKVNDELTLAVDDLTGEFEEVKFAIAGGDAAGVTTHTNDTGNPADSESGAHNNPPAPDQTDSAAADGGKAHRQVAKSFAASMRS